MEKVTRSLEFLTVIESIPELLKIIKEVEKDPSSIIELEHNIKKCREFVGSTEEIEKGYELMYNKLKDIITCKEKSLTKINYAMQLFDSLSKGLHLLLTKEDQHYKELIDIGNHFIDKWIVQLDSSINLNQQTNTMLFDEKKKSIKSLKFNNELLSSQSKQDLTTDLQLKQIEKSLNVLKKWSGKKDCSISYDSKIHSMNDNSLLDKVINKSNLYFISFDQKNNVFGGYVNTKIMNINDWTHDHNAFVFSLTQNGVVKNKRYNIKQGNDHYSFCLKSNDVFLYSFGSDITIYKSNVQRSCCIPNAYEYNGDLNPLVANQSSTFFIQRIIVLHMR